MDNINNILNNIDYEQNELIKINNNLLLTQNQINILKKYNINYILCNSIRDLMIKIEDFLDFEDEEELEDLLYILQERKYYETTNK